MNYTSKIKKEDVVGYKPGSVLPQEKVGTAQIMDAPAAQTQPNNSALTRDYIMNYGKQYGISDKDIGYKGDTGMVTLGGYDLVKPTSIDANNKSWSDTDQLKSAIDTYAQQRGMQSQKPTTPQNTPSKYATGVDALYDKIMNKEAFSYNPNTDASYQAYKDQYAREGERSSADVLSNAAALSGGRNNSWATSAAAQEGDRYAQAITDAIPTFETNAYNKYNQDQNNDITRMQLLNQLDQYDYNKAKDLRDYGLNMANYTGTLPDGTKTMQGAQNDYTMNQNSINDLVKQNYGDLQGAIVNLRNQGVSETDPRMTALQAARVQKVKENTTNDLNNRLLTAQVGTAELQFKNEPELQKLKIDTARAGADSAKAEALYNKYRADGYKEEQAADLAYKQAQTSAVYTNATNDTTRANNDTRQTTYNISQPKSTGGAGADGKLTMEDYRKQALANATAMADGEHAYSYQQVIDSIIYNPNISPEDAEIIVNGIIKY